VIDRTRVEAIRHLPIDPDEKGFGGPSHRSTVTAAQLVAARTSVRGGWLGSPRVHLRRAALRHNIELMASYCADAGVTLYPHGKTTMSPQILAEQLDRGAGGVTVATASQALLDSLVTTSPRRRRELESGRSYLDWVPVYGSGE